MGNLGAVVVVAVVIMLIIYNRRRRARMTPEQRIAEDQVRATREIAYQLRRNRHL